MDLLYYRTPPTVFGVAANAQYYHRQATSQDIPALIEHIRHYSEEDRKKLLVLPEELLKNSLEKNVSQGKYFVTLDDQTQRIVSYLKVFIIKDQEELSDLMENELRSVGEGTQEISRQSYYFEKGKSWRKVLENASAKGTPCFKFQPQKQIYLYFGGAYTAEGHRGKGVNTQLLSYGLTQLQLPTQDLLQEKAVQDLGFLFGQVESNLSNLGMVEQFSQFVKIVRKIEAPILHHYRYLAYKPEISWNEETKKVEVTFCEEGKGAGNILLHSRSQPCKSTE